MEEKLEKIKIYAEWGAGLLLVALSAYFSATLFLAFLEGSYYTDPRLVVVKRALPEKEKKKSLDEYLALAKPLFPEPKVTTKPGGASPQEAALGPLKLVATIIGEGTSIAVINAGGSDRVLEKGRVLGNFTVKEIFKNKVILASSGADTVIRMRYGEPDEPLPQASPSESQQPVEVTPGVIKREMGRREFESLIDPPDRVAREIGFAPVSREGKPYGIQLTFVKPESFLQKMGFLPGDILSTINNKPLYTPEDGMQAYQMMKNEDTVDFKIDRGGRFYQLQIVFK
ncbi:MAG: hypothetical protein RDV48_15420 [Candidatus Eremiobacteraeota bacterium]|nr:hypothetical protein [Candidatus Eremiobacteraeota bacterium]